MEMKVRRMKERKGGTEEGEVKRRRRGKGSCEGEEMDRQERERNKRGNGRRLRRSENRTKS